MLTAFVCVCVLSSAGLHHSVEAWRKPFNPILGETWQATMPGGLGLFMEQVRAAVLCCAVLVAGRRTHPHTLTSVAWCLGVCVWCRANVQGSMYLCDIRLE